MVVSCAAYGCSNSRKNTKFSFFRLPKEKNVARMWKMNVNRVGSQPKDDNYFLCETHFEESCFERDLKAELMGYKASGKKLKVGSIPTIFSHKNQPKKRIHSNERENKSRRKALVLDVIEDKSICEKTNTDELSSCSRDVFEECLISDVEYSDGESQDDFDPLDVSVDEVEKKTDIDYDAKFIVYWSELEKLFTTCNICGLNASIISSRCRGSCLLVKTFCAAGHNFTWSSQPNVGSIFAGNVDLAAGILLTGNTYGRISELFNLLNISCLGKTLFYRLQKRLLFPIINQCYVNQRENILSKMKTVDCIDIAGDGRCDSPGYNAKYGTYSFLLLETNEVVNFHLTHVRHVANSNAMELHGFKNALLEIESVASVKSITTDRHVQIKAFLKGRSDITHQFDIWHVSKSIKKKLSKAAKKHHEIFGWTKSILNHFWWCCKTCEGDANLLREKWCSILYHIRNIHKWKHDENFQILKSCAHGKVSKSHANDVKWLASESASFLALESIVMDKNLLKDIPYLIEYKHTGLLESYHNLMLKYCPKKTHFSYLGMLARTQLTILDHNHNLDREQSKTQDGLLQYRYCYSKISNNWVAKPIKTTKNYDYLGKMLNDIRNAAENDIRLELPITPPIPQNIAPTQRPDVQTMLSLRSRFSEN